MENLNDLGVASNGNDNTLAVNTTTLDAALGSNLAAVQQLFTDPTNGLATKLNSYFTTTTSTNGLLATKEAGFTQQSDAIGTSITNLQNQITQNETKLQNEFVAMEDAINTINMQKEYLTDFFNDPTSTSAAPATANTLLQLFFHLLHIVLIPRFSRPIILPIKKHVELHQQAGRSALPRGFGQRNHRLARPQPAILVRHFSPPRKNGPAPKRRAAGSLWENENVAKLHDLLSGSQPRESGPRGGSELPRPGPPDP